MKKTSLYVAWIVALLATVGSLFLQYALHWEPCVLCWYQRIFIYPLVIILGVAIIWEVTNFEYIVLPMVFLGGLISIYHNLLQYKIIPEKLAPCINGIPCVNFYHIGFNFITIPLLSFITFLTVAISIIYYHNHKV